MSPVLLVSYLYTATEKLYKTLAFRIANIIVALVQICLFWFERTQLLSAVLSEIGHYCLLSICENGLKIFVCVG